MDSTQHSDRTIAAISNPLSGRNKRGAFELFDREVAKYSSINHIAASQPQKIIQALEDFRNTGAHYLIVNGGDGTLQTILTYLKQEPRIGFSPELILLRAGTTSMTFGDVGCAGKIGDVLKRIVKYSERETGFPLFRRVSRPVLQMTIPERKKVVCGMFFGAGAIYSGILYCRQNLHTKGMRGELGPSIAMLRFLFDWVTVNKLTVPAKACIEVDGLDSITGEFGIIVATTLDRLLMGVYPFWGAGDKSTNPALTLIKRNPPRSVKAFSSILRGQPPGVESQANYYHSYFPNSVRIVIENGFTLDGELFGEQGVSTELFLRSAGNVNFLVV